MPTVLTMEIPKPTDPAEFEKIVCEAMQLKWETPRLQRNGRPGQKQDGVDIYGADDLERTVAIQCKRTVSAPSMALIEDEIAKAGNFQPAPSCLYIATTADPDVHLQKQVRVLSAQRVSSGLFAIGLLFWEEVVSGLIRNPEVLRAIYPQLDVSELRRRSDFSRAPLALEMGFYGGNLLGFAQLILGEVGDMVGEDPDQILVMTSLVRTASLRLLPPEYSDPIIRAADEVSREVQTGMGPGVADWGVISTASKRVSTRIDQSSSLLEPLDEQSLRVGLMLGRVYLSTEDPTPELLDRIEAEMRPLLTDAGKAHLRAKLDPIRKAVVNDGDLSLSWNEGIRGIAARDLRHRQLAEL
jgi:hypothetical protein